VHAPRKARAYHRIATGSIRTAIPALEIPCTFAVINPARCLTHQYGCEKPEILLKQCASNQ
jgi:hypothetical protein